MTPTQVAGTYPVTGSFSGDTTTSPQLLASAGHNNAVITAAPTQLTYTGATSAQNGTSVTLSATLTSNGAPLSGQTVVLNLGSGSWKQSCSATTNAAGSASCTVASVNQIAGSVPVTAAYGGNSTVPVVDHLGHREGLQLRRIRRREQWRERRRRIALWRWRVRRVLHATSDRRRPGLRLTS